MRIPIPGKYVFSFGTTMHSTLQKVFELLRRKGYAGKQPSLFGEKTAVISPPKISLEEIYEIYEKSWIDEWYKSKNDKEKYKKDGRAILKALYEDYEKFGWPNPISLEQGFKWYFEGEAIAGRVDRVDPAGDSGEVELIDYKTGNPKDEKTLGTDKDQLLIYQMAWEALRKKPAKLTFHYLEDNSKVSFIGTEQDKQKLRDKLKDSIERIKNSDFSANPSIHNCQYCDFTKICRFAKV